jgi:hypothetical protein
MAKVPEGVLERAQAWSCSRLEGEIQVCARRSLDLRLRCPRGTLEGHQKAISLPVSRACPKRWAPVGLQMPI